jgi:ketosteroid isomerase-like protein
MTELQTITEQQAQSFAEAWIQAWNTHDLDAIMEHYSHDVVFVSPFIVRLLNDPSGTIRGKEALRAYFQRGLETFPDLHFELRNVLVGVSSVTLLYRSVRNLLAAEVMELDEHGQATRVLAHYAGVDE